jgi:hypothetical protein
MSDNGNDVFIDEYVCGRRVPAKGDRTQAKAICSCAMDHDEIVDLDTMHRKGAVDHIDRSAGRRAMMASWHGKNGQVLQTSPYQAPDRTDLTVTDH